MDHHGRAILRMCQWKAEIQPPSHKSTGTIVAYHKVGLSYQVVGMPFFLFGVRCTCQQRRTKTQGVGLR